MIVNSRLPEAECFERWVFDEVLPALRKNGYYHLRYEDVCNLSSRDLGKLSTGYESKEKVILLSSTIDSKQIVPIISFFEPFKSTQKTGDCFEISYYEYKELHSYEYEDYSFCFKSTFRRIILLSIKLKIRSTAFGSLKPLQNVCVCNVICKRVLVCVVMSSKIR